jgi:hypothetical protein
MLQISARARGGRNQLFISVCWLPEGQAGRGGRGARVDTSVVTPRGIYLYLGKQRRNYVGAVG